MNVFRFFILFTFQFLALLPILPAVSADNPVQPWNYDRFVLEDRQVKLVGIKFFIPGKFSGKLAGEITAKFAERINKNNSDVKFILFDNNNVPEENLDAVLYGEIKEFSSEKQVITFSDFFEYDILEQQIKVGLEIKIEDTKNKDLFWKRKASRFNSQRWIDFKRSRIGTNQIIEYFYIPSQLVTGMKKQFSEEVLVDKTIDEVIEDLVRNLVKLK